MAKIPVIEENEDGWSDWQDMGRKFKLICCDCGLSHRFEFIVKKGKIYWRVHRDERSTAATRRQTEYKKT